MPCIAIKSNGEACGRQDYRLADARHPEHLHFCAQHAGQYHRRFLDVNVHHQEGRCIHFLTTHRWCDRAAAPGQTMCATHQAAFQRIRIRNHQRQQHEAEVVRIFHELQHRAILLTWQDATRELFRNNDVPIGYAREVATRYYRWHRAAAMEENARWRMARPQWRFERYWEWLIDGAPAAAPPDLDTVPEPPAAAMAIPAVAPRDRPLAAIAGDAQNVHTSVVVNQTNEMEKKLMAVHVPREQQTEGTIVTAWLALPGKARWVEMLKTLNDINRWFNTKTCRRENDLLYKRLLRGVVAKINHSEPDLRTELYRRLYEECYESVGMCCEGHISRLCNIFVGFDEAFKPPVSLGDVMQDKMAAIALSDLPTEEKLAQAKAWFNDHAVPEPDRGGWLAAIEAM